MKRALLFAVAVLAGCGYTPGAIPVGPDGPFRTEVNEVRLSDGTRCAVLVGDRRGGISCDWKEARR